MQRNFWKLAHEVMEKADILLLVLDARLIQETRNIGIEKKVKTLGKPLIYVLTKSDLADKEKLEKVSLKPSVRISAKNHTGLAKLRILILIMGKKAYKDKKIFKIGVLGYPNVGKSSLINAMKGKNSAPASSMSGYTTGIQKVKARGGLLFIDTPGVIPQFETGATKYVLTGSVDFNKVKNPDLVVEELLETFPGRIEAHYGVPVTDDFEETLATIAKKRNLMLKQATPDIIRVAKLILKDWQAGKIVEHTS